MSERKTLAQTVAAFSKKFNKIDDADKELHEIPPSKDQILQDEINRRDEERLESLRRQFNDYLEPRTQDVEQDEKSLMNAYEFFCKLQELREDAAAQGWDARLRSAELISPLCRRDDYTLGEQMAFLRLWFLQKVPESEVVPEFIRAENGQFYLDFTARDLWSPNALEKEILQSLKESPSNS